MYVLFRKRPRPTDSGIFLKSTNDTSPYCCNYRRSYICGYAHNLAETKGDRQQAAFEAGLLSRRYGLERERVAEFFTEQGNLYAIRFFYADYDAHIAR
ncbi:DUF2623 family protein [Pectobacterium sp. B2J-2]|uniref:DUF2623 family protein n=1 Tax=Pectobacterium sp. B2J-2 TaxID=3385372 RepID=UPI0038FCB4D9